MARRDSFGWSTLDEMLYQLRTESQCLLSNWARDCRLCRGSECLLNGDIKQVMQSAMDVRGFAASRCQVLLLGDAMHCRAGRTSPKRA